MKIDGLGEWIAIEEHQAAAKHNGLFVPPGKNANAYKVNGVGSKVDIGVSEGEIIFVGNTGYIYEANYGHVQSLLVHKDNAIGYIKT